MAGGAISGLVIALTEQNSDAGKLPQAPLACIGKIHYLKRYRPYPIEKIAAKIMQSPRKNAECAEAQRSQSFQIAGFGGSRYLSLRPLRLCVLCVIPKILICGNRFSKGHGGRTAV